MRCDYFHSIHIYFFFEKYHCLHILYIHIFIHLSNGLQYFVCTKIVQLLKLDTEYEVRLFSQYSHLFFFF